MNTSHDLAASLRQVAERLERNQPFPLAHFTRLSIAYTKEKDAFLGAARAIGGKKHVDDYEFSLVGLIGPLETKVCVHRSSICQLVKPAQPAVYDCEPLLSQLEEAELEVGHAKE